MIMFIFCIVVFITIYLILGRLFFKLVYILTDVDRLFCWFEWLYDIYYEAEEAKLVAAGFWPFLFIAAVIELAVMGPWALACFFVKD